MNIESSKGGQVSNVEVMCSVGLKNNERGINTLRNSAVSCSAVLRFAVL